MTAQTPEPVSPAAQKSDADHAAPEAPLTFEAPTPAAPGRPNPIPAWPWGKPITPAATEPKS